MSGLKFTKSHEWVKIDNQEAVIGVTDYAQKQLGDIVFIELPNLGDTLNKDSQFGIVESIKAASELYAPLSGEVTEINEEVVANPQWLNEDPLGRGWLVKIKIENTAQVESLLDESSYYEFIEKEQ